MRLQLNNIFFEPIFAPFFELLTMENLAMPERNPPHPSSAPLSPKAPDSASLQCVGVALMTAAMALLAGPAQAESAPEHGDISLKYLDYLDSQPDADRIKVRASALKVLVPVAGQWALGGTLVTDSISGASPANHTEHLGNLHDFRRAVDADVTRYFAHGSVTLGANVSTESDYYSRGYALSGSHSSDDKNTTWTAGASFNNDRINPGNNIVSNERKHVTDWLLGVTRVLTANDIAQLNVGFSRGGGYFSDPYKVFDNRPRERNSRTVLARWNHYFNASQAALRLSYRYYSDSFDITAHTALAEYAQPLGQGWTVTPSLRLYSQSAAEFYIDAGPAGLPFPPNPPIDAIYFAEDQRLAAFGAHTFGIKLAKQFGDKWRVDIQYEQYAQRAAFRLFGDGSPGLAPFYYRSIQVGLARQF
jgi:hypothetical protein